MRTPFACTILLLGAVAAVVAAGGAGCDSPGGPGATGAGTGGAKQAGSGGAGGMGSSTGGASGSGGSAGQGGAVGSGGAGSGGRAGSGGSIGSGGGAGGGQGGALVGVGGSGAGGAASGGASGAAIWIAPDGLDTNPGTEAQPLKTLGAAHGRAAAGTTIWVKPGTYPGAAAIALSKSGTASNAINVFAAAGARPLFDFSQETKGDSAARGLEIKGDYWHIKGIEVANAGDNCVHITGSHNTIEGVVIHECGDTGLQITVDSSQAGDATRGAYNTIVNCDSYGNFDEATGGENADGFAAKLYIGPGNVFRGCRAWNNADDGWDFFASNDVVVLDGCWAFLNGKTLMGQNNPQGDGNGFKLGGAPKAGDANMGGAVHQVTGCFAFENVACGFVRNNNPSVPMLSMCGGRDDGKDEYCSLSNPSPVTFIMTGAQAKAVARNADGSLPAIY
jgi:hypothetical protein